MLKVLLWVHLDPYITSPWIHLYIFQNVILSPTTQNLILHLPLDAPASSTDPASTPEFCIHRWILHIRPLDPDPPLPDLPILHSPESPASTLRSCIRPRFLHPFPGFIIICQFATIINKMLVNGDVDG